MKLFCTKNCSTKRCPKCWCTRNLDKLQDEFPWLVVKAQPFGAGCSVCMARTEGQTLKNQPGKEWCEGTVTLYASLQPRRLEKHQNSKQHRLGLDLITPVQEDSAPSTLQLKTVLDHAKKHPVGVDGVNAVGGQKKVRKIVWCLAEANRELKRQLWRDGKGPEHEKLVQSTTLFQDTRKGRLSLRFTAASSCAERRAGHFGTIDISENLDALGVMQGTMNALKTFCTPCQSPPHCERPPAAELDVNLLQRVVQSIEVYVTDSAGDEIRAGFMLAGQSATSMLQPHFPGLRVVSRDKPHATRRNLSRGFKADDTLSEVLDRFVLGTNSPTRLIHNSVSFKSWFAANVRRQDPQMSVVKAQEHIKDLGFAAHRFESLSKPLSRIVLFFPAFLQTVHQIATTRAGQEAGDAARDFLGWLSVKAMVLVAMLSDAAAENVELTRLVDFQGFAVETLPNMLCSFRDRIRALFGGGGQPACLTSGFTGHMLTQVLQRPLLINVPARGARGAVLKELGGSQEPSPQLQAECLKRMANWVRLVESTLQAEFPCFEVLQAFAIFNVQGDIVVDQQASRILRSSHVSRLQSAFGLPDDPEATEQLQQTWHVARRHAEDGGLSSINAWLAAAKQLLAGKQKHRIRALMPILLRFFAAGASTSGVEQAFSRAKALTENIQLISHVNDVMEALRLLRNCKGCYWFRLLGYNTFRVQRWGPSNML